MFCRKCDSDDLDFIRVDHCENPPGNYFTVGIFKCKICGTINHKDGVNDEDYPIQIHELTPDERTEEYRKQIEGF